MIYKKQIIILVGYGKILRKYNDFLKIEDQEDIVLINPSDVKQIIISGKHAITTSAIRLIFENDIDLILLDSFGRPIGHLIPCKQNFITDLWEKQITLPSECALDISKEICKAAIYNKLTILRGIQKNFQLDFLDETESMKKRLEKIDASTDTEQLRGLEGNSAKSYYNALKSFIPEEYGFSGRTKHPPLDPVNSLLSYGYGILYSQVRYAIIVAGLNQFHGIFHSTYKDREALVYDLTEEFRQPIVDRVVLTMISRNQVSINDFSREQNFCYINNDFKKKYADVVLTRMEKTIKVDSEKKSFNEIIENQARILADAIRGSAKYKAFIYR